VQIVSSDVACPSTLLCVLFLWRYLFVFLVVVWCFSAHWLVDILLDSSIEGVGSLLVCGVSFFPWETSFSAGVCWLVWSVLWQFCFCGNFVLLCLLWAAGCLRRLFCGS